MKVLIAGPVTASDLADAELMAGIEPTEFLSCGEWVPPASAAPLTIEKPCPKIPGDAGVRQRLHSLLVRADALVCTDGFDHLTRVADGLGIPVYEA